MNLSFENYRSQFLSTYKLIDFEVINKICDILSKVVDSQNTIFAFGNGGSTAIANHFACDFSKGSNYNKKIRYISLSNSSELITAISNDIDFDQVFSFQLDRLLNKDDVVIAISSSGNSKNIINGLLKSRDLGIFTISLTGFDGGKAKDLSDLNLNISSNNYGIIEDCHSSIMHFLSQKLHTNE